MIKVQKGFKVHFLCHSTQVKQPAFNTFSELSIQAKRHTQSL